MTRRRGIDAITEIARIIGQERFSRDAYGSDSDSYSLADAQRANDNGWTLYGGGWRDAVVRTEGIHLTPEQLARAWELSERYNSADYM